VDEGFVAGSEADARHSRLSEVSPIGGEAPVTHGDAMAVQLLKGALGRCDQRIIGGDDESRRDQRPCMLLPRPGGGLHLRQTQTALAAIGETVCEQGLQPLENASGVFGGNVTPVEMQLDASGHHIGAHLVGAVEGRGDRGRSRSSTRPGTTLALTWSER